MKLLGSTKNKTTKDENNVPHLEITEVVLGYCDIVNNDYKNNSRVLYIYISQRFHIWKYGLLITILNR